MIKEAIIAILRHLARKPGHDEVKADFRQLLVEEFGAELSALDFGRCVPEVRGRLDALIGRPPFERGLLFWALPVQDIAKRARHGPHCVLDEALLIRRGIVE